MKEWSGLPLVISGCGDIATEVLHLVNSINKHNKSNVFDFKGYISEKEKEVGTEIYGSPVIASDEKFEDFSKNYDVLGVVIPHSNTKIKGKIINRIKSINNLVFPNLIHPLAGFEKECVSLGVGNIITAGVEFTTGVTIGDFNLLNLSCTIGHQTVIENYCTILPLVAISGGVKIYDGAFIGTGAKILQYKIIGEYSIIGAGAVVIKDVEPYSTEVGVPAKCIKKDR